MNVEYVQYVGFAITVVSFSVLVWNHNRTLKLFGRVLGLIMRGIGLLERLTTWCWRVSRDSTISAWRTLKSWLSKDTTVYLGVANLQITAFPVDVHVTKTIEQVEKEFSRRLDTMEQAKNRSTMRSLVGAILGFIGVAIMFFSVGIAEFVSWN